jgi:enoyl-CoA hydratase/carnithine racemase
MSESLQIRRDGRVLILTLNRPDKRNALNEALCDVLTLAIHEADQDRSVGCILLSGSGPVFCAGMDLDEATSPDAAARTHIHQKLFTIGTAVTTPIVAAAQGAALAGGVGLLVNSHVVVAAEGTRFGLTEIRIGMWPLVIYRATSVALGERRALELSLTGRIFGTSDALQYGLIHEAVPPGELEHRSLEIARSIATSSPEAVRLGLYFLQQSQGLRHDEAARLAAELRATIFASDDFAEGVRAFRERRAPRWPSLGS